MRLDGMVLHERLDRAMPPGAVTLLRWDNAKREGCVGVRVDGRVKYVSLDLLRFESPDPRQRESAAASLIGQAAQWAWRVADLERGPYG